MENEFLPLPEKRAFVVFFWNEKFPEEKEISGVCSSRENAVHVTEKLQSETEFFKYDFKEVPFY